MRTIVIAATIILAGLVPACSQTSSRSGTFGNDTGGSGAGAGASSGEPGTNEYGKGEAKAGLNPSTPPNGAGDAGAPKSRR